MQGMRGPTGVKAAATRAIDTALPTPGRGLAGADAPSDVALVDRFQAGERSAFDELVRRYQRPVYHLARRYLRNDADAADVTQRTFVRMFESLGGFRGASSVRTWIFRIAINLSLNHIRDSRRSEPSEIHAHMLTTAPLGASRVIADEETARLHEAIEALPPKQRMVLELRIYDDLSFREVAELAGCTENTAKVNFHHAVKRLRTLLTAPVPPSPSKEKAR